MPGFTGREDLLTAIDAALWQKGGTAALTNDTTSAAVKGLGGVGKSVLAREYAWLNRERYRGVWWVRAKQVDSTLPEDLIELGSRLIPDLKNPTYPKRDAVRLALEAVERSAADKPWLIVYDNVEKPSDIRKLKPRKHTHILITSRWPDWQDEAQELPVDVFAPGVAIDYLIAKRPHETREAAARLAAALGHLPLALSHARAYCAFSNVSFASYLQRLPELIDKAPEDTDYPKSVFATFSVAMDKAAEKCPQAEKLMGIAAFLEAEHIPLGIITGDVMSESERDDAVAALAAVSLLTCGTSENGGETLTVHRLVQEVMRGRIGQHRRETRQIALRLVHSALDAVTVREHINWPHVLILLPHAIAVLGTVDGGDHSEDAGSLCNLLGIYFQARGNYPASLPYLERALAIAEAALGPNHPTTGTRLNNLAGLYENQARYAEAEPLYKRAAANAEVALGPDHFETGARLTNLAGLYQNQGRNDEAEPLFKRALTIAETALGPDNSTTAASLNNFANFLMSQGREGEAEPLFRRAVAITQTVLGPDHRDTGTTINNLALLYMRQGRSEEAEPLFKRALIIAETALGPEHPDTGVGLYNLGHCYTNDDRYAEAEPLYQRALAIAETSLGSEHPDTGLRLNNLAYLYWTLSRYRQAEPLYQRALAIFEKRLGSDHPSTRTVRANYERLRQEMAGDL